MLNSIGRDSQIIVYEIKHAHVSKRSSSDASSLDFTVQATSFTFLGGIEPPRPL